MRPQLAVDELKHLVRPVGAARPRRPAILPVQPTPVHLVAEFRLLLALILGFVERLEEEQPSELLDVVPWSHTVGVELVAGVLHRLLDLLTPVPDAVVVRSGHSLASLTPTIGTYSRCFTASRSDLSTAAPPYRDSSELKLPNWVVNCGALYVPPCSRSSMPYRP